MGPTARDEIKDFLRSRRARLTPSPREIMVDPRPRRVAGLRRDEVAARAAISPDYYVQLERGKARGVSDSVLASLMDALELDPVERSYLSALVAQLNSHPAPEPDTVLPPGLHAMVAQMSGVAVVVRNHRMDMLTGNRRGRALFRTVQQMPQANIARHVFEPESLRLYPDYDEVANFAAGTLRTSLAAHPGDAQLLDLVDDLRSTPDFDRRWSEHHVLQVGTGIQRFADPDVGAMTLAHCQFLVRDEPELVLTVYRAEDGSGSQQHFEALDELVDEEHPGPAPEAQQGSEG